MTELRRGEIELCFRLTIGRRQLAMLGRARGCGEPATPEEAQEWLDEVVNDAIERVEHEARPRRRSRVLPGGRTTGNGGRGASPAIGL